MTTYQQELSKTDSFWFSDNYPPDGALIQINMGGGWVDFFFDSVSGPFINESSYFHKTETPPDWQTRSWRYSQKPFELLAALLQERSHHLGESNKPIEDRQGIEKLFELIEIIAGVKWGFEGFRQSSPLGVRLYDMTQVRPIFTTIPHDYNGDLKKMHNTQRSLGITIQSLGVAMSLIAEEARMVIDEQEKEEVSKKAKESIEGGQE